MCESEVFFSETYYMGNTNEIPTNLSGIYSWHVKLGTIDLKNLTNYAHFFKGKIYDAKVSSYFNDIYEGTLRYTGDQEDSSLNLMTYIQEEPSLNKMLEVSTLMQSPAIYIGKSKELKQRITTHKKIINDIIVARGNYQYEASSNSSDYLDFKNFSERFANLYLELEKDAYSMRMNNLFVKIVGITRDLDNKYLLALENYLNKTFKPPMGKR